MRRVHHRGSLIGVAVFLLAIRVILPLIGVLISVAVTVVAGLATGLAGVIRAFRSVFTGIFGGSAALAGVAVGMVIGLLIYRMLRARKMEAEACAGAEKAEEKTPSGCTAGTQENGYTEAPGCRNYYA